MKDESIIDVANFQSDQYYLDIPENSWADDDENEKTIESETESSG